ncbi:unnamed protein product [Lampetra planeri]
MMAERARHGAAPAPGPHSPASPAARCPAGLAWPRRLAGPPSERPAARSRTETARGWRRDEARHLAAPSKLRLGGEAVKRSEQLRLCAIIAAQLPAETRQVEEERRGAPLARDSRCSQPPCELLLLPASLQPPSRMAEECNDPNVGRGAPRPRLHHRGLVSTTAGGPRGHGRAPRSLCSEGGSQQQLDSQPEGRGFVVAAQFTSIGKRESEHARTRQLSRVKPEISGQLWESERRLRANSYSSSSPATTEGGESGSPYRNGVRRPSSSSDRQKLRNTDADPAWELGRRGSEMLTPSPGIHEVRELSHNPDGASGHQPRTRGLASHTLGLRSRRRGGRLCRSPSRERRARVEAVTGFAGRLFNKTSTSLHLFLLQRMPHGLAPCTASSSVLLRVHWTDSSLRWAAPAAPRLLQDDDASVIVTRPRSLRGVLLPAREVEARLHRSPSSKRDERDDWAKSIPFQDCNSQPSDLRAARSTASPPHSGTIPRKSELNSTRVGSEVIVRTTKLVDHRTATSQSNITKQHHKATSQINITNQHHTDKSACGAAWVAHSNMSGACDALPGSPGVREFASLVRPGIDLYRETPVPVNFTAVFTAASFTSRAD